MGKFESPPLVQRKLEAGLGKNASKQNSSTATFQCFCETGPVENRECSGRSSKITEKKIDEVHDVTKNQRQTSVRTVATAYSIF